MSIKGILFEGIVHSCVALVFRHVTHKVSDSVQIATCTNCGIALTTSTTNLFNIPKGLLYPNCASAVAEQMKTQTFCNECWLKFLQAQSK